MDRVIGFTNRYNTKNITFMYSTPQTYLDMLKKDKVSWPVKYDDGFPYSDAKLDFWTGYFASRPTYKQQIRDYSGLTYAAEGLFARKAIEDGVSN